MTGSRSPTTPGRHAWGTRTVVHTPSVTATPRQVAKDVDRASSWLSRAIDQADDDRDALDPTLPRRNNTELLIVDEAARLKMLALGETPFGARHADEDQGRPGAVEVIAALLGT